MAYNIFKTNHRPGPRDVRDLRLIAEPVRGADVRGQSEHSRENAVIDAPQTEAPDADPIEPSEEAIRLRSQQIWEREGFPEGMALEHWGRARTELIAEQEHWMRATAELAVELKKTSPAQALPPERKEDLFQSVFDQAIALMPKTSALAHPPSPPLPAAKYSKQTPSAPSIIAADIVVTGALDTPGDIQLDGCVEGNVRSAVLVVDGKGVIKGDVIADDVTVRGCVRGSIRARKVHLCAKSRVEGDIYYGVFSAEAGAQLDGSCRHADDPLMLELAPEEPLSEGMPRARSAA